MDNLETPYDVEAEFIECTVCDKSIRGETLYKIHLTTSGHIKQQLFNRLKVKLTAETRDVISLSSQAVRTSLDCWFISLLVYPAILPPSVLLSCVIVKTIRRYKKIYLKRRQKEEALVAAGVAVKQHTIPEFTDILQYLDYLKLDEPIIGLSYLDEVPGNDKQAGPTYTCRLCHITTNLPEMVHHVIGRKHRQKYVELKRPDLVTWDKQSIITQGGKIIRARAEIIERQDGRGNPNPMAKRGTEGKRNISRVPPSQKQNWDQNNTQRFTQRDVPPHLPEHKDYDDKYFHQGRYHPSVYPDPPSFHPDETCMNRDRQTYQQEDGLSCDYMEEDLHSGDYRESNIHRQEYEEEYVQDPHNPDGVSRYDPQDEMPIPRGQSRQVGYYPKEAPPIKGPFPERDALKEFYTEEVRRRRIHSEYQASQQSYPEDKQRWSVERESGRYDGMNRARRQGSTEPEAKRRSFATPTESDNPHDHLFNIIKDYQHKMREPCEEVVVANPGLSRTGPPSFHRQVEVTRTMPGIPEPFRRFLTGASNDEGHGKRKRKSRFSDATAEEVERTNEMFSDEYGPPNPKFGGHPRPVSVQRRPETHGAQHPDPYIESQSPHHSEMYQRGGSGSESVFDMLKSIEIENAEEADFLKNKLCSLLRDFKSRKSENAVQKSQSGAVVNSSYSSLKPDPQLSPQQKYERNLREDLDLRQPQGYCFQDDHRGRNWKQPEYIPDEQLQEYHGEPRLTSTGHYEEVSGCPEMSWTPHATRPDEPRYQHERFQEPMHPQDYHPAANEYFDSRSSASTLHIEQNPRMHRGPQYSKNLDKITSTLLELVARK